MEDEHVTSVLNKQELTAEEIIADAARQVVNYLYIIHGSGSDRDRRISIDQLKEWIAKTLISGLTVGTGANYVEIKDVKIKFNKSDFSFEISMDNNGDISVSKKIVSTNGFEGNLLGNVTGNVTGNVNGDVEGDVTGDVTGNVESGNDSVGKLKFKTNLIERVKNDEATTQMSFDDEIGLSISNRTRLDRLSLNPSDIIVQDQDFDLALHNFTGNVEPKNGDVVVVENNSSSAITVYVHYKTVQNVDRRASVNINPDCAMMFYCIGRDTTTDTLAWYPLFDTTVTWNQI